MSAHTIEFNFVNLKAFDFVNQRLLSLLIVILHEHIKQRVNITSQEHKVQGIFKIFVFADNNAKLISYQL
jgi:hypothetical protein